MSSLNKSSQHFAEVPEADIQRSTFDRSNGLKTTIKAGVLTPIFIDEVLPGDTHQMKDHLFGRLATPIVPFMDNLFLDTHYFFVPTRLVWENWEKFNGAQTNPDDSTDYIVPQMVSPAFGYGPGSVADYMGIPTGIQGLTHSALPFRAYQLIWNEWYRDENLQDSLVVPLGDGPDLPWAVSPMPRGKRKDYFTSALPFPQKGPAVNLPLGTSAPVVLNYNTTNPMSFINANGGSNINNATVSTTGSSYMQGASILGVVQPNGRLTADLTEATAATINSLRLAFQVQKMYERDARGGTRYVEIIKAHFNVTSPDFRLQRPEFLGGNTKKITSTPVAQTSSSDATTPQGNLSAYSVVSDSGSGFNHSFTEHGYIIGLVSLRADLNYQQGLERFWSRKTRFDYYWPALSHLGEQPILNKEIYAQGNTVSGPDGLIDDQVFGYQEKDADYRYKPNKVTGLFRSQAANSLDIWHLAQDFEELPLLNEEFIEENPPIDRILAVTSDDAADLLLDIFFEYKSTRPMPTYAVPGLVDHF